MNAAFQGVLLDTNALIYSLKNRVDIQKILNWKFNIFKIAVPDCVIMELETLSSSVPYARGALQLSQRFERISVIGHGDNCLMDTAKETGMAVLSNDRILLGRLKRAGVRCFTIKGERDIVSL